MSLTGFLTVSAILFSLGMFCILSRRNAIAVLLGIELILNASGLNFAAFNFYNGQGAMDGQIFTLFIIVLAAVEATVAFAIVLAVFQTRRNIQLDSMTDLKG